MKITVFEAAALAALAFSGTALAGDVVINESFTATMNANQLDNANIFGEGVGANIGGQTINLTLSYDITSFYTYNGYSGAPACGTPPCTGASYGAPGYYADANGESWTQNPEQNSSLTISYEVNGQTVTISNSPGSGLETDISIGGNPAGFEANMYGFYPGGGYTNNGCCENFREFFNGTTAWVPGSIDTQAGMDAFAATVTTGSFWYVPSPQFSAPYDILYFSNVQSASSATPEPGTIGLLGSALAGLGLWARRRRQA